MVITMLSIPTLFGAGPGMDLIGVGILSNSMGPAAKAVYPGYDGSFNITWIVPGVQTFRWDGIAWASDIVLSRLALIFFSIRIAALSAVFFDRFNPSRLLPAKGTKNRIGLPNARSCHRSDSCLERSFDPADQHPYTFSLWANI